MTPVEIAFFMMTKPSLFAFAILALTRSAPAQTADPFANPPPPITFSQTPVEKPDRAVSADADVAMLLSQIDVDDDNSESELEPIVVREIEKLPPQIRKQFEELPAAEKTRIYESIRSVGVKIPATVMKEVQPTEAAELARREQAAQLLQRFANLKSFSRTASDILNARGERMATAERPKQNGAALSLESLLGNDAASAAFPLAYGKLVAGDWPGLQEQLSALPASTANQVYLIMLTLLSTSSETLTPTDVLSIAEAAPEKLNRREIATLARLLVAALKKVDRPDDCFAQLHKGGRRLGDADPERRAATARLLVAANQLDEATKYLVPLEKAIAGLDANQLNLHGLVLLRRADAASDGLAARRAWEVTRMVLDTASRDSPAYREVFSRATSLLGKVPAELSGPWLRSVFENEPREGARILAGVARRLDSGRDASATANSFGAWHLAVARLTPVARAKPQIWKSSLELLVLGWAGQIQALAGMDSPSPNNDDRRQAIPSGLLLASAPDDDCLALVDAAVAWRVRQIIAVLAARAGDDHRATELLREMAKHDAESAKKLGEEYLAAWIAQMSAREDDSDREQRVRYSMGGRMLYRGNGNPGESLPLTRSRQIRSLKQLRAVLDELKKAGVPALGEEALVAALVACHSPAEIYHEEDVANVFGPIDALSAGLALKLSATMRENLAGQWRNPAIQDAQGTHRTDAEIIAEIKRGYELAIRMLGAAAGRPSSRPLEQPQLLAALAALQFDRAEFLYDQHADLPTYAKARDEAFVNFGRAHAAYAKQLPELPAEKHTAAIYGQWFLAALGASDTAAVSPKDRPNSDQVQVLVKAIRSLDAADSHEHLGLFAKDLSDSLNRIPPHMKPSVMREALRVLGDHESARPLRRLVDYYQDLLGEIELHVGLDGAAQVGREPFGAWLTIRGTSAVIREAGGFTSLLVPSMSSATGQPVNRKEKLEKEIREKFGPHFEILQVRFHEPNVQPRTFGRDGWRETPLAYLVLKAKDSAVDRLVPLQLDLEFNDGHGVVVLPINSESQLIDARGAAAPRPLADLKVKQTLDDRKMTENIVRLEIAASGNGLIPNLPQVLNLAQSGTNDELADFTVANVADHGLSLSSLNADGGKVQPLCERQWTIELTPRAGSQPAEFRFPAAVAAGTELSYARFDDADLVAAAPVVALHGWALARREVWLVVGGLAVAISLLVGVTIAIRVSRSRWRQRAATTRYHMPEHVTPLGAVAILKRLNADTACAWRDEDRDQLAAEIERIEEEYFARGGQYATVGANGNRNRNGELDSLLRAWLDRAVRC